MVKRVKYLLLAVIIMVVGFVSAINVPSLNYNCSITDTSSCNPINSHEIVVKLSANSNAHGELFGQNNYGFSLCCDLGSNRVCSSGNSNKIIGLSSDTNAHAQIPSLSSYPNRVCYDSLNCSRYNTNNSNCDIASGTENRDFALLTLSSDTNAHLGDTQAYLGNTICCKLPPNPNCQFDSASSWQSLAGAPISGSVAEGTFVKLVANATRCSSSVLVWYEVFESDSDGNHDSVANLTGYFGSEKVWRTKCDGDGDDTSPNCEYFFRVKFLQQNSVGGDSGILNVDKGCYGCICSQITDCGDYTNEYSCINDVCSKANSGFGCSGGICSCYWDSGKGLCGTSNSFKSRCGNNKVDQSGEVCDGTDLGGHDCTTFDYIGGTLGCYGSDQGNLSCNFDKSSCTGGTLDTCGNGFVGIGEECEGNIFQTDLATCSLVNSKYVGGTLGCYSNSDLGGRGCRVNTNNCIRSPSGGSCGDGTIQVPHSGKFDEQCDPNNKQGFGLNGTAQFLPNKGDCSNHDGFNSGTLGCTNYCTYDYTACSPQSPKTCGDGVINQINETCDGADLGGYTCEVLGYDSPKGTLKCGSGCQLDVSGCMSNQTQVFCGDGLKNQPWEECDDGNRIGAGDLCDNFCRIPTNSSVWCGDNVLNSDYEECDDGNQNNTDSCSNNCKNQLGGNYCGDGSINQVWENCDDGNNIKGDGCSAGCLVETEREICGDGVIQQTNEGGFNETCDLDNLGGASCSGTLGCKSDCTYDFALCSGNVPSDNKTNRIEEECDGTDLRGRTCKNLGYSGGTLFCDNHKFNTSLCIGSLIPTPYIVDPSLGTCRRIRDLNDDCEDGFLVYNETATWIPFKVGSLPRQGQCGDRTATIECPAQLRLPFFSVLNVIISLAILVLVYGIVLLKRKKD